MTRLTADELLKTHDLHLPPSDWVMIDQAMINTFADVTRDHQFIHVDVKRAESETPFGGTIAHGFLTLSLLSGMTENSFPEIVGLKGVLNYGLDKLRFLSPVHANSRVRAHFELIECTAKDFGQLLVRYNVSVEIEGNDKPALVADWLAMVLVEADSI